MKGVISVFPSEEFHIQTTRSWDFLGLRQSIKRDQIIETDLVIGVIDIRIWPESESFNDKGLGPIPKKWRGVCAGGGNFSCNNKIIGARFYGDGDVSARYSFGHRTHTASTAGGREVEDVSFYGFAKGTARGGVPSSRIAAYKICGDIDNGRCSGDAILAAFDDAISDGVDVITVSLGPEHASDFLNDPIAIGSFHAMEKGILTTQAAGNFGPIPSSVCSGAPWLVSVAATSIDRQFIDKVILGNGKTFVGKSINITPSNGKKIPIAVRNAQACLAGGNASPEMCDCIDENMVKGKLVLCGSRNGKDLAYANGAIGSIHNVTKSQLGASFVTPRPSLNLKTNDFVHIQSYTNSNISVPGVEILAAYSPLASPSYDIIDKRQVKYTINSGTSTSCPHVAGVVAYVKSFHPDWSPAAIKSAIMTTTKPVKGHYDDLAGEFAYGSGNINPQQAIHPGLVYDITKQDYVQMLCDYDINYPAMVIPVHKHFNVKIHRTVTNVGFLNSTYKTTLIHHNSKIKISVEPKLLSFKSLHEKKSFVVTVIGEAKSNHTVFSSSLIWSDGTYNVKSPIIVQRLSR
ncbi:subtilisin-like serine endopeptidase family protein [Medicago truncatula]|uniref:Subtilisin-like serine endopeptidase family protein n=2 Tax=Medicago truncatula TaxID=3880 RepID=A0A072UW92_MEDTR|nr:subtilisin-like serine endopeptidase family protein [Medicago truncatula]KEH33759.1 subtilisin-like serine endopeptidase family protein [Medicago truncatula]